MKKWYTSKTLWVNFLAIVSDIILNANGFIIPENIKLAILAGINMFLRFVTKTAVVWE